MSGLYDGEFAGFKIASSEEIDTALREAVVAVDANVLLDLYRFRPQTSQDLINTLKSLDDRLVVPHQALREFWRHRQRSQGSPRGATKLATDALAKSGRAMRDALTAWAKAVGVDDDESADLASRVDDFVGTLKDELQQVLQDTDAERAAIRSSSSWKSSSRDGSLRRWTLKSGPDASRRPTAASRARSLPATRTPPSRTTTRRKAAPATTSSGTRPPGTGRSRPRPPAGHPGRKGRLVVAPAVGLRRPAPELTLRVLRTDRSAAVPAPPGGPPRASVRPGGRGRPSFLGRRRPGRRSGRRTAGRAVDVAGVVGASGPSRA